MKYKRVQHLLALASEEEAKLANILNGAKQETFLKVSFTERVLHSSCPEDHYYVLTHHDDKMKIKIDKAYDLSCIDYKIHDEILGTWNKEETATSTATPSYCLDITVNIGLEDPAGRKEVFKEHLCEAIGLFVHADAGLLLLHPTLLKSKVKVSYCDGVSKEDTEEYGIVEDHINTYIKK